MLERATFLEGMSHAASTVSVVTTDGAAGRAGVTVSAMCSVSADPPSLLVCVHHMSRSADVIRDNGVLCVNVLRDDQAWLSDVFAGRIAAHEGDRFAVGDWHRAPSGAPALGDALVTFDCSVEQDFRFGSHRLFVATVNAAEVRGGNPLVYANRAYGTTRALDGFVDASHGPASVRLGFSATLGPFVVPRLLAGFAERHGDVPVTLLEGTQAQMIQAVAEGRTDLALLYNVPPRTDVSVRRVASVPPHVLLPAGHALGRSASVSLHDLCEQPMVLLDTQASRDYFLGMFAAHGLEPRIGWRSSSFETVRGLVGNGLGYSLLVTKPANAMSCDGRALISRPLTEPVPDSEMVMVLPVGGEPEGAVGDFVRYCAAELAAMQEG